MPAYKHPTFSDRIMHAASAKAALLERYKSRPGPDDPSVVSKNEERRRIHEERLARQSERQRLKDEERTREAEEKRIREEQEQEAALAQLLQAEAEAAAAQQARRDRLAASTLNAADQKALRDARYAARKARQKR